MPKSHARKKKKKNPSKHNKPWVAVKNRFYKIGDIFPTSMSREDRLQAIRTLGSKAKEEFNEKYPKLRRWFEQYDSAYILSFCAFYFLSHVEGIDPEISGKGLPFYTHYLEILQSFSLIQKRNFSDKPLLSEALVLKDEMIEIGSLMSIRVMDIPSNLSSLEELEAFKLRTDMIMNTIAVRNWAYFHQMKKVTLDLSVLIDGQFQSVFGSKASDFIELLFNLTDQKENALNIHRDKVFSFLKKKNYRDVINAYHDAFPETIRIQDEGIEQIWNQTGKNLRTLKNFFISHSDLSLEHIYTFTIDDAVSLCNNKIESEKLKFLFDQLKLDWGDLSDINIDRIILSNPVNQKPFIQIEDNKLFSAIWGNIPHLALSILEDFVWSNENLRNSYTEAKSKYLEDEIEKIFREGFPSAQIYKGSLWSDDQNPDKIYENDLIVVIDSFAIIIEAKSGIVSDPAKRGAPERLFETLRDLIEAPSEQALRFIEYLKTHKVLHNFSTKKRGVNHIDSSKINYYIPLGITFSHLGTISSNLKKLIAAGVVKKDIGQLIPSINFTDIESIFELLPLEAEKLHYFSRRREIEAHLQYEGDELDLLAFYLEQGFNIGETEYSKEMAFNLIPKSKELDPYLIGKAQGRHVKKPELTMTKWWKDILNTSASRKIDGWIETSFILLNSTKEDQIKFEKGISKLKSQVKSGKAPRDHNWILFISGSERRCYAIAFYPYTTNDKELRNDVISRIIDETKSRNVRGVTIIGDNLLENHYPYSVLARSISTDLFDSLTD